MSSKKLKVKFPAPCGNLYYDGGVKYIYNILTLSDMFDIELVPADYYDKAEDHGLQKPYYFRSTSFYLEIDSKKVLFEMSDIERPDSYFDNAEGSVLVRTVTKESPIQIPMGPFMCDKHVNIDSYYNLINFDVDNIEKKEKFFYNNRLYGWAYNARLNLYKHLGTWLKKVPPEMFWKQALEAEYNIFLPGANPYVLDRAPSEMLYLGGTVMHPEIKVLFPYYKKLVPGEHYIEIAPDGLDCLDKMDGTHTGEASREFMQCAHPKNLVKWWLEAI